MTRFAALMTVAFALAPILASADEPAAEGDDAAIRKNVTAAVEAFNKQDAKALAALWSPDAVYTSRTDGTSVVGREAIEKDYQDQFEAKKDRKIAIHVSSIDFVSPNVAIERGTAKITGGDEPVDESEYSAVHVKRDGQWLLDRVTEDAIEEPPSHYEQLKELEWLVGNWVDHDDEENAEISTECQWAKNKNFITRAFKVSVNDRIAMSGMQIIGYDAADKKIRSWVFDSDGGYGEGVWTRKGNSWHIKQAGVLPEGQRSSEVNILTKLDDNAFTWQSTNREVDGELQPNVDEVKVVRDTEK